MRERAAAKATSKADPSGMTIEEQATAQTNANTGILRFAQNDDIYFIQTLFD
jgi:hypothetical protein